MAFEHQNYSLPPPPPPPPLGYHHFVPPNSDYAGTSIASVLAPTSTPKDQHYLLYGRRYVHPKIWNGCPWVEIKYFQQDPHTHQLHARKGGICLSMIEFDTLVAQIPLIRQQLKELTTQPLQMG